jgi:cytoplasmic iron level regulating protein YaaA (DUF328/UPF0246 family)
MAVGAHDSGCNAGRFINDVDRHSSIEGLRPNVQACVFFSKERPMLMVISPAKTLDYDTPLATLRYTQPAFIDHAKVLIDGLRELSPAQLGKLMSLSDKLAGLNAARFGSWSAPFTPDNARPAILAFKGDVYTGLGAEDFSEADFDYAQQHLRMLSGLYGLLRPLDLMQPYRLEMGTALSTERGKDLYAFWGARISHWLNVALEGQGDNVLLNLASKEYFSAIKRPVLSARVVECEFRDFKNGDYKIISFHAKKARGLMARFVIKNRVTTPQALQAFTEGGYRYAADRSNPDLLVFLRDS